MITRRSLIATLTAIPAMVIAPFASRLSFAGTITQTVPVAAPPAIHWEWWASPDDDDVYRVGPFPTRETLLEAARNEFGNEFHIVEAVRGDPYLHPSGSDIIELINGLNKDRVDPGGDGSIFNHLTDAQLDDLGEAVAEAIDDWIKRHGIRPECWAFDLMRNQEEIGLDKGLV